MKDKHKDLTLTDRIIIEQGLNAGKTFTAIAKSINKDPSTISKEVKKRRTIKQHKWVSFSNKILYAIYLIIHKFPYY